jgi:hypothetical protein
MHTQMMVLKIANNLKSQCRMVVVIGQNSNSIKPVNKIVLNTVFKWRGQISPTTAKKATQTWIQTIKLTIRTKEIKNDPTAPLTIPQQTDQTGYFNPKHKRLI